MRVIIDNMEIFNPSHYRKYILFVYSYAFDKNFWLLAIFTLGIGLRILGTNPGYPEGHPDESTIADSAARISFYLNFEPVGFYYGSLLPIVYALMNWLFFIPLFLILILPINLITSLQTGHTGTLGCLTQRTDEIRHCILSRSNDYFYFLARYETAIVSALAVIFVYFLCKELFNKRVGIAAAFFTAVNYRHVLSSNLSLADSPASTIALISVLLSIGVIKQQILRSYLFAGLGLGLAFSVKYFIYVTPVLFVCHAIAHLRTSKSSFARKLLAATFNLKLLLSLAVSILVFFALNPFLIINHKTAQYQLTLNASRYNIDLSSLAHIDLSRTNLFPLYYLFRFGLGEFLSLAIVLGFLYAFVRHKVGTIIIVSLIAPFFFFLLILSGTPNVRNYASIIPFLMIFPAILFDRLTPTTASILARTIPKRFFAKLKTSPLLIGVILLTLIIGFSSLKNSFLSSYYFSKPRNQELLLDWAVKKLPDNTNIAKTWGVPFPSYKKVETLIDWSPVAESYMSIEELKELKIGWVMVSSDSGTYISNLAWVYRNDLIKKMFLDEQLLWDYLDNNYPNLLTQEIGYYRIREFTKGRGSLDPEFFVSEIPAFWEIKKDNLVTSYKFDKEVALYDYSLSSSCYELGQTDKTDEYGYLGLNLRPSRTEAVRADSYPSQLFLATFQASENKWYTVSGKAVLKASLAPTDYRSGFLRLDFYSKDNQKLKTYVSRQLSKSNSLQDLNAAGMAPAGAILARVAFQSDTCQYEESYLLHSIEVFESKNIFGSEDLEVITDRYPYFYKDLPKIFIWQPPL